MYTSWYTCKHADNDASRLRVAVEEECLLDFFGREYVKYRQRVKTRLPGVD